MERQRMRERERVKRMVMTRMMMTRMVMNDDWLSSSSRCKSKNQKFRIEATNSSARQEQLKTALMPILMPILALNGIAHTCPQLEST